MTNGPDNAERLFQHLDDLVAEIIDRFANEGHGTVTVIETLQDVIAKRRLAYDRDPDPALRQAGGDCDTGSLVGERGDNPAVEMAEELAFGG